MKYHIPARYMYVWSICTCKTEYTNTEMSTLSILVQNSMSYTIKFVVKSPWILNTSLIPTGIQGICFINFFVDFFIFHFSLLCMTKFPPFFCFFPFCSLYFSLVVVSSCIHMHVSLILKIILFGIFYIPKHSHSHLIFLFWTADHVLCCMTDHLPR